MNITQSEWPEISVIIPTYNRPKILLETIVRLHNFLRYSGVITYHVGIDGEHDRAAYMLVNTVPEIHEHTRLYYGPNKGLGANLNALLEATASDFLFQLDDDHHLLEPLNLDRHVRQLIENDNAGWIRLMGIGGHTYQATLHGTYWYIDWNSHGDYALYIPSMRPHLKHRRFHNFYGMYPEGKKLGETEEAFCHQCIDTFNKRKYNTTEGDAPYVLVPLNSNSESAWAHVGESWQQKGL